MYINPYILGPALGAFFGYLMGCLMNSRAILSTANWIPGYVILGALAGLNGAAVLSGTNNGKKEDWEKGEFLTETKSYKKKHAKKKDKVNKD